MNNMAKNFIQKKVKESIIQWWLNEKKLKVEEYKFDAKSMWKKD